MLSVIEKQREILKSDGKLTQEISSAIEELIKGIKTLKKLSIPVCAVQGDYDFYYNILFNSNEVSVVDFEHFEKDGLPYLDLATLIFNPILIRYENSKISFPLSLF